jgi:hypothetical protein
VSAIEDREEIEFTMDALASDLQVTSSDIVRALACACACVCVCVYVCVYACVRVLVLVPACVLWVFFRACFPV